MRTWLWATALALAIPSASHAFLGMNGSSLRGSLPAWTKQFGISGLSSSKQSTSGYGTVTDSSGNFYLAGSTSAYLGGGQQNGYTEAFVAKYSSSGAQTWIKQIGPDEGSANGDAVGVDSSGNVYLVGHTSGPLNGLKPTGNTDSFIIKYDSNGNLLWTRMLGGNSGTFITVYAAVVDPSGNVYYTGDTQGGGIDGHASVGQNDLFIVKYDTNGNKKWSVEDGTAVTGSTTGSSMAYDPNGYVYVAGFTMNKGLDGNSLVGTEDLILTKYDTSGTRQWTKEMGVAAKLTKGLGVTIDSGTTPNVYITGYTTGNLDGQTITGSSDLFLVKFNSTGTKQWTKLLGVASSSTSGTGASTDGTYIYLCGSTTGNLDGHTKTGSSDAVIAKYDNTGAKQWTALIGATSATSYPDGIAIDGSGNITISGYSNGNLNGVTLNGTQDAFLVEFNSTPSTVWTNLIGGKIASAVQSSGTATDASGNIYVVGTTTGSGLFGNSIIGSTDIFLVKFDMNGTLQWAQEIGAASGNLSSGGVAVDSSGNVYISGNTNVGLDGHSQTGNADLVVYAFNSSGTKLWSQQVGTASVTVNPRAITVDSSANVYAGGSVAGGGFDGNSLVGNIDVFVTKFNSSGTKQWTKEEGSGSGGFKIADFGSVTTDASGNVYLFCDTNGSMDGLTMKGTYDLALIEYNSSGTRQWITTFGASGATAYATGVVRDSSGNFYLAAETSGAGLGGNSLIGTYDGVLMKVDSSRSVLWTKEFGVSSATVTPNSIAIDSFNNIYLAGYTTAGLNGNQLTGLLDDLFTVKYDAGGILRDSRQLGASNHTTIPSFAAFDGLGNLLVTGRTYGNLDLNSRSSGSFTNMFVLKYSGY